MKLILYLLLFLFVTLYGCEMLSTKDQRLVGRFLVVNPRTQDDNGYSLIFHNKKDVNENVVREYISNIIGNDTLLLVKCTTENPQSIFYKIRHVNGEMLKKTEAISSREYDSLSKMLVVKYSFSSVQ